MTLTTEEIAAALRRTALARPGSRRQEILRAARQALGPLVGEGPHLAHLLDALVEVGDLVEASSSKQAAPEPGAAPRVFLGAPRFVPLGSGALLITGIYGERDPPLPCSAWEARGALRVALEARADQSRELLSERGYQRLDVDRWAEAPAACSASEVIEEADAALLETRYDGRLDVFDPRAPVDHYRRRLKPAERAPDGRYLGRREGRYGEALRCYVEIARGRATRLADLPVRGVTGARDEALRLEAALNAAAGNPLLFRRRAAEVDLFAPPPSWAARRLWAEARELEAVAGALTTHRAANAPAARSIASLMIERLWLQEVS